MREIIFRGKTADGKWVKGAYVSKNWYPSDDEFDMKGTVVEESNIIDYNDDCLWVTVIPETVGQYTGLTDKNGKKIFEGDIVKIYLYEPKGLANYEVGCIKYDDTKARFVLCTEEGNYGIDDTNIFEIIGNIHDNPELLKGGGE